MAVATLRFYEELNDFLPFGQRKREFAVPFEPPAPVRHIIEGCGVPHTEVELILRNGVSVGLEEPVTDGDRIAVYPLFEALDISPLLRIRDRPLREPRFLVDSHLGKLARYLRMLGFDTRFAETDGADPGDRELARIAAEERRILLTHDRALLMHRRVTHGCFIRRATPRLQLAQVIARLDLCGGLRPFTRCMECNQPLAPVPRDRVLEQLPPRVRESGREFFRCAVCERIYWKGSHYRQMEKLIAEICAVYSSNYLQPELEPSMSTPDPRFPPSPADHTVVVLGATPKTDRYANMAQRLLMEHGYRTVPVHPKIAEIEGVAVVPELGLVEGPVHTLTLYVGPDRSAEMSAEILALNPLRVIFNPGTESAELEKALTDRGVECIRGCTLVMLKTKQF